MESKDKFERQHRRNLSAYELSIDRLYQEIIREAARIGASVGEIKPGKAFSFEDYPTIRKRVEKLMSGLKSRLTVSIVNGIDAEWTLANNKNSELARRVFGENATRLSPALQRRYFSTNDNARQAFQQRKVNGLNLSERVWRYADQFKEEIEMGLDLGIRNGLSAQEMTRDLRDYLRHPDKLFRRVRDEHGILHLSKRAAAYHPGRGVYRSSYMNARRLAATEANIAYRTSDHLRWQQMDFVVGMEIRLSDNHTCKGSDGKPRPFTDICDKLAGRYPKDFKFTGWHPHCRCYAISILKTQEEIAKDTRKILNGEKPDGNSVNRVDDVPQEFKDWIADNAGRIDRAKSLPYFMRDNEKYVRSMTTTPAARAGLVEAQAFNQEMMMASTQKEDALLDNQISEVMAKAKEVGDTVQSIAVSIAQKYDARCTPINYKSAVSIRRKVNTERQNPLTPDYSPFDMKDTVRTTIVVEKSDIENVIATLSQETGVKLLGKKGVKRQYGENYIGYTGTIINVKMDNELIAEIQVNTPKMIYAKEKPEDAKRILGVDLWNKIRKETGMEGGLGHKYYEAYRVLNPNSNEAKKLKALSEKYYSHFTK